MKITKMLDYLQTLFKLKRNFASDMATEADTEGERKYYAGRADAFNEAVKEVDVLQTDAMELRTAQERADSAFRGYPNAPLQ